jgi:FdrA protein
MAVVRSEVRSGTYYDSVVLMQLQRALAAQPGVADAGVVMATPANWELLAQSGLLPQSDSGVGTAGPDDMLIVVKAADEQAATEALRQVNELLVRRRTAGEQDNTFRPRSLEAALKALLSARWVQISVPGRYAAGVARDALNMGRHVFLYSDNVALEDEIQLKELARQKGLLLMGPDCGTAIIAGVGLGFANRVRRGSIGLVGASGTGLQAVTSQIHNLGAGVSQAIGTGGRDLSAEVKGITACQGVDLLGRDVETQVIVLVSKPPAPEVAAQLLASAQATGKKVVVHFIGQPAPARRIGNFYFATSLGDAAALSVQVLNELREQRFAADSPPSSDTKSKIQNLKSKIGQGYLRGLFSGGTLAYEALLGFQATLAPIFSNAPLHPRQALPDGLQSQAHTILDLGADEFTVGRLHPMMDYDLRLRRLRQEAADPEVAVILLDVVLGAGAHPDPAAELAPVIAQITQQGRPVIGVLLVGTDQDPQNMASQAERLAEAGAIVFNHTMEAVTLISRFLIGRSLEQYPQVSLESMQGELAVINVGLESFYESVRGQGAQAVHVEWRPPAGGNEKLMALLAKMKK